MSLKITPEQMRPIEAVGYGISGYIGGLPRTTYYTPDGRVIRAIPSIHVNQVGQSRDANLDKGWLLSPPAVPKPFCKGCDRWHDTPEEVAGCITKQAQFVKQAEKQALQEQTDRATALETKVAELTALVNKLMEAQGGRVFQPETNGREGIAGPAQAARESGS